MILNSSMTMVVTQTQIRTRVVIRPGRRGTKKHSTKKLQSKKIYCRNNFYIYTITYNEAGDRCRHFGYSGTRVSVAQRRRRGLLLRGRARMDGPRSIFDQPNHQGSTKWWHALRAHRPFHDALVRDRLLGHVATVVSC